MNIRRRSKIRDMLEQLMPFDDSVLEEEFPSDGNSSLVAFLYQWEEDPTFLEVFERLCNRLLDPEISPSQQEVHNPVRVFTDEEERLLSTEARGYILKLRSTGIIDTSQVETVIERAFECWTEEISLEQVRFLVAAVLIHEVFGTDDFDINAVNPPFGGLD